MYGAGRYSDALDFYTRALEKAKNEENDQMYYICLGNIGNVYASMNDIRRALHYYKLGYDASLKAGDIERQWGFSTNIVAAYCMLHDVANAKAFFDIQMKIPYKDTKIKRYYFLNNQAYIAMADGNMSMSEYYFQKAMAYSAERKLPTMYYVGPLVTTVWQYHISKPLATVCRKCRTKTVLSAYSRQCRMPTKD